MKKPHFLVGTLAGLLCLMGAAVLAGRAPADTMIYGAIYTVNPAQPWAEVVAIRENRIVYVGDEQGAEGLDGPSTRHIELPDDAMVLPGLHDIHMHPLEAGSDNYACVLDAGDSVEDWIGEIEVCAEQGEGWLLGHGFSLGTLVADGRHPRQLLDQLAADRPVAIMEETSHAVWVNSRALAHVGFETDSANPPGGLIGQDTHGRLNGLLFDTAGDMVFHAALDGNDPARWQRDYQGLMDSLDKIRRVGLTTIGNARVYWQRGSLSVWQRAAENDALTARAVLALWFYPEAPDDVEQVARLSAQIDDRHPMLRVDEVKLYVDGISINSTAAMHQPYQQDLGYGLASPNYGLNYFDQARLGRVLAMLQAQGFRANIHAIGDRGVHEALNAIEFAQEKNRSPGRHRLTHVEYVSRRDLPRFAQLGVTADAQVAGEWTMPAQHSEHERALLGSDRMQNQIPLAQLKKAGANITLSSDWDVSPLNPFVGMQHALTRGNHSLENVHQVIEAYTRNAAYALAQEQQLGSLEPGKLADLTIIDRNLFTVPVDQIERTQVLYTIVDGEIVYREGE